MNAAPPPEPLGSHDQVYDIIALISDLSERHQLPVVFALGLPTGKVQVVTNLAAFGRDGIARMSEALTAAMGDQLRKAGEDAEANGGVGDGW